MNAVGIVAEYNPFHNGHLYHLEQTKKMLQPDAVVAVMSGNFTQRGEPAIADKWLRAEAAVISGVDLVLELPFVFACNNAEYFAKGAIRILDGLGCVSHYSFGSEKGETEPLMQAAEILADEDQILKIYIKDFLNKGFSYPKARYEALKKFKGDELASIISEPNNILAVEYIKETIRLGSSMRPFTVKRKGSGYHDRIIGDEIASATAIREKFGKESDYKAVKNVIPEATAAILDKLNADGLKSTEDLYKLLIYKVLTTESEELAEILSAGEGLENKLKRAAAECTDLRGIIKAVKSKRYTETRIKRFLIHTLLGLKKESFFRILEERILYARILGISERGACLLRHIKKHNCASIPILTNIKKEVMKDDRIWNLLNYDVLSSELYNLIHYGEIYSRSDYVHKLFVQ